MMKNYFEYVLLVVFGCMGFGGEWVVLFYFSEYVK